MNTGGGCRSILEGGGGGGEIKDTLITWSDNTSGTPLYTSPPGIGHKLFKLRLQLRLSHRKTNLCLFTSLMQPLLTQEAGGVIPLGFFFFFLASNRRLRRASPRAGQKNKSTSVNLMDTTVEIYILTFAYFLKCVLENRLTDFFFFLPYTGRRSWVRVPRHNYFLPAPF